MNVIIEVIDSMLGHPAEGVHVRIESQVDEGPAVEVEGRTDENGQFGHSLAGPALGRGIHRLELDIDGYFATVGLVPFQSKSVIEFRVLDPAERQHIVVMIAPYAQIVYSHVISSTAT